jgi:dipeptidyl-peptidase-4
MALVATESFPRLAARTMNFRLGLPRGFEVSPDGQRVVFLRALSGTDRAHALWVYDVASGSERLVADPAALLGAGAENLTQEERARRERQRVTTSGIVAFSTDADVTKAAFALSSRLFVVDLSGDRVVREFAAPVSVVDPQLDPTGRRVAYAGDRAVRLVALESGADVVLVGPEPNEPEEVAWGLAEFVANEELDRARGFWWAPDGESLLVERYDESGVLVWHISDPANPEREPMRVRYPQSGTANALVSLAVVPLSGARVDVDWRSDAAPDGHVLEYLAHVEWSGPRPILTLLTRDQRRMEFRELDPSTGTSTLMRALTDDAWVELLPGTPRRLDYGRLLYSADVADTRRLWIDGEPFTPEDVLLREVIAVEKDAVIATIIPKVASVALARLGFDGSVELLSDPDGVATGAANSGTLVIAQQNPSVAVVTTTVRAGDTSAELTSLAETSPVAPNAVTLQVGERGLPTTVLFPTGHERGSRRLPVLLDPYGGPHGQRVINAAHAYLTPQWFADQGFLVIVADGRGMAGRGPAWDRLALNDRAGTIDDQAEAFTEVARLYPDDVDSTRVAIRGWSFGGYLALLGVLRRPDVFSAAIAGAPTTDEQLYDTCYSERYLGDPNTNPEVYEANNVMPLAPRLSKPLMIIHGLSDDNVYVAHSLRLSSALLAAGRPHEFIPLSGITHLANSEEVAENLLVLQVEFLRRSLKITPTE